MPLEDKLLLTRFEMPLYLTKDYMPVYIVADSIIKYRFRYERNNSIKVIDYLTDEEGTIPLTEVCSSDTYLLPKDKIYTIKGISLFLDNLEKKR
jgi:hypothetical protein